MKERILNDHKESLISKNIIKRNLLSLIVSHINKLEKENKKVDDLEIKSYIKRLKKDIDSSLKESHSDKLETESLILEQYIGKKMTTIEILNEIENLKLTGTHLNVKSIMEHFKDKNADSQEILNTIKIIQTKK